MLKMNELIERSKTPKSTILYYIKEGLLPEPFKEKANLHLYSQECVEIIEFIKYLQSNFNSTIAEIKALFGHPNFDIKSPYEALLGTLELVMGASLTQIYSADELCKEFKIDQKTLEKYVKDGFLMPREGKFTAKEREILAIIMKSDKNQLEILKAYINLAKKLAKEEVALTFKSLEGVDEASRNESLKHLFDILLIAKPYILNMHTLEFYQKENR